MKSFIEVADNLDLAIGSVPEKELEGGEDVDVERALTLLKRLRDGVVMTESIMLKVTCVCVVGRGAVDMVADILQYLSSL